MTAQVHGETSALEKPKLTSKELRYAPVYLLYKDYLVAQADAQDNNLENFMKLCRHYNFIPSVDLINWIIHEANIIDEKHRLNFPIYAFLQESKFTLSISNHTKQVRLLVGKIRVRAKTEIKVWAGSHGALQNQEPTTAASIKLYLASLHSSAITKLEVNPEAREQIVWEEPLEKLFELGRILETKNLRTAAQVQNAIFLSVIKVVLRFPGLRESDKLHAFTVSDHPELSGRPFDNFDDPTKAPLPTTRYQRHLEVINYGFNHANGVHRCHPPDQQAIPGNKATKRKREDLTEDADLN